MSSSRPRAATGFTLLEVMCAFAILAIITSLITQICHEASDKGGRAMDLRALREAADTVFRRLCYEDGRHTDGMRASLDDFYAAWAELPSIERDRWRSYQLEFRRRPRTAAGEAGSNGAEPLGGSGGSGSSSTGSGTGSSSGSGTGTGTGSTGSGSDDEETGVELMQLTLTIFHEDDPNEPLITLQTLLPPQGETKQGTKSTTSGGSR